MIHPLVVDGSRDFAHLGVPICREENVSGHKFKIGQSVRYAAPFSHSAAGDYKVALLLPTEDNELQYCIKSANEPHKRVAKESQLQRTFNYRPLGESGSVPHVTTERVT
jgi:hypothetical protein